MAIQLVREFRETALAIFTPLPFVLLLIHLVETATNPVLQLLCLYPLLAFAFETIRRMVEHTRSSIKTGWKAADPSTVEFEGERLRVQVRNLAAKWISGMPEVERDSVRDKCVEPVLPGIVFGTLNSLLSVYLYFASGTVLALLDQYGRLQGILGAVESLGEGPQGTFVSAMFDFAGIEVVAETAFAGLSTENAILLALLFLLPGYFAIHAARQLTHVSEQVHVRFLKYLRRANAAVLSHEATGVACLFVAYLLALL